ncbi:hypothetical protein Acr_15g0006510 [Actinidia rufa]|uniref:Uncharacterized protein n=1 Tax=Actinidia rufa TaxID=165716 RepID=A0A7J0FTL0_9ERIC|nr:hypothetical protein Acr_15g0006510 [Actinidia rufa]
MNGERIEGLVGLVGDAGFLVCWTFYSGVECRLLKFLDLLISNFASSSVYPGSQVKVDSIKWTVKKDSDVLLQTKSGERSYYRRIVAKCFLGKKIS